MVKYRYIDNNFMRKRSERVGSSDIPAILVNPEKPTESLAGYGRTAITVYKDKIGQGEKRTAGLDAEMGHYNENKSLELFIRTFYSEEAGRKFRIRKEECEARENSHPVNYQAIPFHHNVQYYTDGMIVHPDMLYDPNGLSENEIHEPVTVNGISVDFSKPFIVEAKSARLFASKRPDDSIVKGYDFSLTSWQGIPLKHYVQIQYQLALMQVDVAYLSLIYDTANYHVWKIEANKDYQRKIIDVVGRMVKHIQTRTLPKELAMNQKDIQEIYPVVADDYCMVVGDQLKQIEKICREKKKASDQQKIWKDRETDAKDALSVMLKGFKELRSGSGDLLAKWAEKKNADRLSCGLKDLEKNDPVTFRYLERKGYIKLGKSSRYVSVKFKG